MKVWVNASSQPSYVLTNQRFFYILFFSDIELIILIPAVTLEEDESWWNRLDFIWKGVSLTLLKLKLPSKSQCALVWLSFQSLPESVGIVLHSWYFGEVSSWVLTRTRTFEEFFSCLDGTFHIFFRKSISSAFVGFKCVKSFFLFLFKG